jgi:hypothetical protein
MEPSSKQVSGDWQTSLWLVVLLTALTILPVFLVEIPAMLDYPNHLARMYLLAASGTPNENPYYTVTWKFNSNLAMDIIVPALGQFLDVATATKAFLVLSQILVVSGSAALEVVVKRRHEFAGFVAAMALYCVPFAWGFLNFEFATGLALWGIAFWLALENRSIYARLAAHSLFVFCIFVSHFVALGLYGATIGFYALYCICRKFDAKQAILTLLLLVSPAAVLLGYIVLSGTQTPTGDIAWNAANKLRSILGVFNGYNIYLSASYFIVVFMLAYVLFRSRSLKLMAQGKWIAAGFLLIFLALPFQEVLAEVRVVTAAILIMPAFLIFSPTRPATRLLPPLVFGVIALLNAGHVATIWVAYQPEYDRLKASFRLIERGAFVLSGWSSSEEGEVGRPFYHAPVLAVHYANAFVPTLFTTPGQYALRVRPDLQSLNNDPVPYLFLEEILAGRGRLASLPSHIRCWMDDYDYLYLIGPPGPNLMPSRLTALAAGEQFALYRIIKPPEGGTVHENTPSRSRTLLGNTTGSCQPH